MTENREERNPENVGISSPEQHHHTAGLQHSTVTDTTEEEAKKKSAARSVRGSPDGGARRLTWRAEVRRRMEEERNMEMIHSALLLPTSPSYLGGREGGYMLVSDE